MTLCLSVDSVIVKCAEFAVLHLQVAFSNSLRNDSYKRFVSGCVSRFIEDLTASSTGGWYSVISLHGGGSPQAMKREIYRRYPIEERRALVERLLDRGVAETGSTGAPERQRQPGQCCATGCQAPDVPEASSD